MKQVESKRNELDRGDHVLTLTVTKMPAEVVLEALKGAGHDCPDHKDLTWNFVLDGNGQYIISSSLKVPKSRQQRDEAKRLADLEVEKTAKRLAEKKEG